MEITQRMINSTDLLALGYYDVEQLQPAISDIQYALGNYPNMPQNAECVVKINFWVSKFKTLKANDTLDAEEVRQLKLDLETSY